MFTDDNIYYRDGTYGDPTSSGTGWTQISGALVNVAVGDGIVVGTNSNNVIYIRLGMFSLYVICSVALRYVYNHLSSTIWY